MSQDNGKPQPSERAIKIGMALQEALESARKTARMHGTPICFWRDGKVVSEKP